MIKNIIYLAIGFVVAIMFGDKIMAYFKNMTSSNTNTTSTGTYSTVPSPAEPKDADL
ncbi:MAG: hypothetical protein ACK5B9_05205 [Flavobacteriia bacterium]|jgi:hypothetical protein